MNNDLDELQELYEINPVLSERLRDATSIDRRVLRELLVADVDKKPAWVTMLRRSPATPAARVGYVGAGLLVAAGFAAVALVSAEDLPDDLSVGEPGTIAVPVSGSEPDEPTLVEVPADDPPAPTTTLVAAADETEPAVAPDVEVERPAPAEELPAADEAGTEGQGATSTTAAAGQGAATGTVERPSINGPFDPANDLLSIHHGPHRDDGMTAVAAKEITTWLKIEPHVVADIHGEVPAGTIERLVGVMDATWGDSWIGVGGGSDGAIQLTAELWLTTIDSGGEVWVAEGGPSDFTATVLREIADRRPDLDTQRVINVIQHSATNEMGTSDDDFNLVLASTTYQRIDDGNMLNGTADLRRRSEVFEAVALSGRNADSWRAAFAGLGPNKPPDFSDTVAILHMIGVGIDTVKTPGDFARMFMG